MEREQRELPVSREKWVESEQPHKFLQEKFVPFHQKTELQVSIPGCDKMVGRAIHIEVFFNNAREARQVINNWLSGKNVVVNNDPAGATIDQGHTRQSTATFSKDHF